MMMIVFHLMGASWNKPNGKGDHLLRGRLLGNMLDQPMQIHVSLKRTWDPSIPKSSISSNDTKPEESGNEDDLVWEMKTEKKMAKYCWNKEKSQNTMTVPFRREVINAVPTLLKVKTICFALLTFGRLKQDSWFDHWTDES